MRVLVIVVMIMCVLVCMRCFGLLLAVSFVSVISVGVKSMPSRSVCVCRVVCAALASAVYASLLLYESSLERVKPPAVAISPDAGSDSTAVRSRQMPCCSVEKISSPIFHCVDWPGCSTTIPVSSSLAHSCPNGSSKLNCGSNRKKRPIQRGIHPHRLDRGRHRRHAQAIVVLRIAQLRHRPVLHQPLSADGRSCRPDSALPAVPRCAP